MTIQQCLRGALLSAMAAGAVLPAAQAAEPTTSTAKEAYGAIVGVVTNAAGLPVARADAKVQAAREVLFGSWEMNWIVYNHGHDVALPKSRGLPASFLMYPNAETEEGRLDSLNPATFRYAIHSREVEPA